MTKPLFTMKGQDGIVELWPTKITIKQIGMMSRMNKGFIGDKDISLRSISSVQLKKPRLTNGYIQFVFAGSQDRKSGLMAAVKDNNTVMLTGKDYKQGLELKLRIEQLQAEPIQVQARNNSISGSTRVDQLSQLAKLLEQKIISREEFEKEKALILGS